ncbi:MAG: RNA-binding transcriptional accessory protein [Ottowia sp.]|nr:RNA-binding transcriptional accessory protein [Ottowia sp.]
MSDTLITQIAAELAVRPNQVAAAIALLDEGATVPFIARYRKEATDHLDDTQLRHLEERLIYLRELQARRATILESIQSQGKLTDALRMDILSAATKQALEDYYLPYKPKRRTRADIARAAGLAPLAEALLDNPMLVPEDEAAKYLNDQPIGEGGVPHVKAALEGARDILAETFAQTVPLLHSLRAYLQQHGVVSATLVEGKAGEEQDKFRDYYNYSEPLNAIPSHRTLAILRARNSGILQVKLGLGEALDTCVPHPCESMIATHFQVNPRGAPADKWLSDVYRWCWRVKLQPQLELDLLGGLREQAEKDAIHIFARNLQALLLAAPAGAKVVMGIDPGIRTGCKVAVVDVTGKLLETATLYPHAPRGEWDKSIHLLKTLCTRHQVDLVAIGNGTASRETDKLVGDLIEQVGASLKKIVVSEAGASVYSASELAAKEFPDLDVSLRGAVSIARRLQDPLAELVKIDPKSIGVGQYQHDVNQTALVRSLDSVVEDCVNAVGVDLNTASAPLLARVSGLNGTLAKHIVMYRDTHGAFINRAALKKVPRLGDKAFEQAAGFLRINQGDNPLDCSAVHPEAYPLVEQLLKKISKPLHAVMGQRDVLKSLVAHDFVDEKFGLPTVMDILAELEKPGRDPRPEFKTAVFNAAIEHIKQLEPGMILEGVVTNVAAFGAFVDIGVHQDGLVHISALADRFVKDPQTVVKAGQVVKVKVIEVDAARKRIALSMRLQEVPQTRAQIKERDLPTAPSHAATRTPPVAPRARSSSKPLTVNSAMADAFAKLRK